MDPRRVVTLNTLAATLTWLRRYDEARATAEDGIRFAPTSLQLREMQVMAAPRCGLGPVSADAQIGGYYLHELVLAVMAVAALSGCADTGGPTAPADAPFR